MKLSSKTRPKKEGEKWACRAVQNTLGHREGESGNPRVTKTANWLSGQKENLKKKITRCKREREELAISSSPVWRSQGERELLLEGETGVKNSH